nr:unnamed protein product [Callosobruchus analis]
MSFRALSFSYRISHCAILNIVYETCHAIWQCFCSTHMSLPTIEEWKNIALDFYNKWNFPNCIGCIDGKHIRIKCPKKTGSTFFNYKSYISIVLQGIADANYKFIAVEVGAYGRQSDEGTFSDSNIYQRLEAKTLNIPGNENIPSTNIPAPYVLLGDDAYPLKTYLLKPYSRQRLVGSPRRIYNYRLSRARRIVENAFGLLSAVFRIFIKPIAVKPDTTEALVFTCIHLHNFLRRHAVSRKRYSPSGTFDIENVDTGEITPGSWRRDTAGDTGMISLKKVPRKAGNDAKLIREEFMNYFMSPEGSVSWQESFANK